MTLERSADGLPPSLVTDNETDPVSTGQGRHLYDAMTCPKAFRRFTRAEGAEGHCEGMAPMKGCSAGQQRLGLDAALRPVVDVSYKCNWRNRAIMRK